MAERVGAPIQTDSVTVWPEQGRAEREAASGRSDRMVDDPPPQRVGIDKEL
jgi:hypothetical protein